MYWEEIVKTALLGTERTSLPQSVLEQLEQEGIDIDENLSKLALQAAAFYGQQRKVGMVLKPFNKPLPRPVLTEAADICSARSSQHLKLILKGDYDLALVEFINLLIKNNKKLPPESIPKLLENYKKNPEVQDKLLLVLGEYGYWLIQQNPEWQAFIPQTNPAIWKTGNKNERLSFLKHLRQHQPTEAIKYLQSTWKEEAVRDKVGFLKALALKLSKKDEWFLENCLDDRRKEVRQQAARLLASIPDSALVDRMYERCIACFSFSKEKLSISLPNQLDKEALRDGINPALRHYMGGIKASRLGQMIAKVPPHHWVPYFGRGASNVLRIFERTQWKDVLLQALLEASINFKDEEWIAALLDFWINDNESPVWEMAIVKDFIAVIPERIFNQQIISYLERRPGLVKETYAVSQLLRFGTQVWFDRLTLLVIKGFQNWLLSTDSFFWNTWHYRQLLISAAYQANPNLYEVLNKGWRFESRVARSWETEVKQFLKTLVFRKEMISELSKQT